METWILVWILIFQPTIDGGVKWEFHSQDDLNFSECVELLAEKNETLPDEENYAGHEIYCKENK